MRREMQNGGAMLSLLPTRAAEASASRPPQRESRRAIAIPDSQLQKGEPALTAAAKQSRLRPLPSLELGIGKPGRRFASVAAASRRNNLPPDLRNPAAYHRHGEKFATAKPLSLPQARDEPPVRLRSGQPVGHPCRDESVGDGVILTRIKLSTF